jgi:PHD/YefM family antitoxin component YafN of YafNO toxin-antitoxin module
MLKLKPEYITKNGRREFVVLTVEDYEKVKEALEDAEDLRILQEVRRRNAGAPTYSLAEVRQRLGLSRPRKRKVG